jgi:subtilisin family serine protease
VAALALALTTASARADDVSALTASNAQIQQLQAQGVVDILVKHTSALSANADAQVRAQAGVNLVPSANLPTNTELDVVAAGSLSSDLATLNANPDVVYAEPDAPVTALPGESVGTITISNGPSSSSFPGVMFGRQWALANTGQAAQTQEDTTITGIPGDDVGALSAWSESEGAGVTVAVVDSGFDYNAQDLQGQSVAGYDFLSDNADPQDQFGHGTFVSSEIAGKGDTMSGLAPASQIMPLRVLDENGNGSGGWAAVAEAFNYAGDHNVPIVNASLGSNVPDQTVEDAITSHPNTLFVFAAGNSDSDNDTTPFYPCNYAAANVICVGATDNTDAPATFSDYGASSVDLFAPGVGIYSEYLSNTTATVSGCTPETPCSTYTVGDGTSFATPLVSATAALMLSLNPALTPAQIKAIILANTTAVPALSGLSASGGVLDSAAAVNAVYTQVTAPEVAITDAPPTTSTNTAADISFTTSGGDLTSSVCTLDGAAVTPCASGATLSLTTLSVGAHVFEVAVSGPGGSNSSEVTWTVLASAVSTSPAPTTPTLTTPTLTTPLPTTPTTPTHTSTKPSSGSAFAWSGLTLSSSSIAACAKSARVCASTKFSFDLTRAASIVLVLSSTVHGKSRVVASASISEGAGVGAYTLSDRFAGRVLAVGSYELTVSAHTSAGAGVSAFHATLRVR